MKLVGRLLVIAVAWWVAVGAFVVTIAGVGAAVGVVAEAIRPAPPSRDEQRAASRPPYLRAGVRDGRSGPAGERPPDGGEPGSARGR